MSDPYQYMITVTRRREGGWRVSLRETDPQAVFKIVEIWDCNLVEPTDSVERAKQVAAGRA